MNSEYYIRVVEYDGTFKSEIKDFQSLYILDTINDLGSWKLRSSSYEKCPIDASDYVYIFKGDMVIYFGVVTKITNEYILNEKSWHWEVTGTSFIGLLKYRTIFPSDVHTRKINNIYYPDCFQNRYRSFDNEEAVTIAATLINENVTPHPNPANLHEGIDIVAGCTGRQSAGHPVTTEYRFEYLLEAIIPLLNYCGSHILVRFENSSQQKIYYELTKGRDVSDHVIFSDVFRSITSFKEVDIEPAQLRIVASLNSTDARSVLSPEMWEYAAQDWFQKAPAKWTPHRREKFFVPDQKILAESPYDFTESGLTLYTDMLARQNKADSGHGYEIELNTKGDIQYSYGYNFKDGDWTADYMIGDIVCMEILGEKYFAQVMQMEISIEYGRESYKPRLGTVTKGAYRTIQSDLNSLTNYSSYGNSREISPYQG